MLDIIARWWALIESFLLTESATRAIVFGLLLSWGLTHTARFYTIRKLDEDVAKHLEEVVSFLSCFLPCLLLWPNYRYNLTAFLASSIVALWSPYAYKRVGPLISHYFPFLNPVPKSMRPNQCPAPTDPSQVTVPAPLPKADDQPQDK